MGESHVILTGKMAALETDGAGQTPKRQNAAKAEHAGNTLRDYYQLLRDSQCFRIIWIGEVSIPFNGYKALSDIKCFVTPSIPSPRKLLLFSAMRPSTMTTHVSTQFLNIMVSSAGHQQLWRYGAVATTSACTLSLTNGIALCVLESMLVRL